MPVSFLPLPVHGLVLFTYSGHVGMGESMAAITAAARHPAFRPGMRHLVDVSAITGFEKVFPTLLSMQAKVLDDFPVIEEPTIVLWYAPTRIGQEMAQTVAKSWAETAHVRLVVQEDEEGALSILGLRETRISQLLTKAGAVQPNESAAPVAVPQTGKNKRPEGGATCL
ncbi:hypothetical protein E7811_00035 [Aliigemmobacter aestuarii]|uniref:Uncharacterized protein n=1 Tax=Aliigemmobacter aestuarii TaxID=1445661 RepID=A0A4S3MNZ9_9RHOB|nr:hypothetical protein [Gemmobacter aestuarii]THD84190.1 hypothetical protein E7811_00035 [Gemmobacter aestuarii]